MDLKEFCVKGELCPLRAGLLLFTRLHAQIAQLVGQAPRAAHKDAHPAPRVFPTDFGKCHRPVRPSEQTRRWLERAREGIEAIDVVTDGICHLRTSGLSGGLRNSQGCSFYSKKRSGSSIQCTMFSSSLER